MQYLFSQLYQYDLSYADNFLDAIGLLGKPFIENGGKLIGRWPTEGYEFDNSLALDGDEFLGLGLDNDNEEELSEERMIIWAELIKDEFELWGIYSKYWLTFLGTS